MSKTLVNFLGKPNSGKGVQCKLLASGFALPELDVGILLTTVAENKNHPLFAVAQEVLRIQTTGGLNPCEVVNPIVDYEIVQMSRHSPYAGVVTQGAARKPKQGAFLVEQCRKFGRPDPIWIEIVIPHDKDGILFDRNWMRAQKNPRNDGASTMGRAKVDELLQRRLERFYGDTRETNAGLKREHPDRYLEVSGLLTPEEILHEIFRELRLMARR